MPEAPPVVVERARALDRAPEALVGGRIDACRLRWDQSLGAHSTISREPASAAAHRHLHGQIDGAAHRFRAGDDEREGALVAVDQVHARTAVGEREQRVVAAWREHVLEGKRAQDFLAGAEAPAALVRTRAGGHDDRQVVFVEHIQARDGVLDLDLEAHERLEHDPLALGQRGGALAVLVLDPCLQHARVAVATAVLALPRRRWRSASRPKLISR